MFGILGDNKVFFLYVYPYIPTQAPEKEWRDHLRSLMAWCLICKHRIKYDNGAYWLATLQRPSKSFNTFLSNVAYKWNERKTNADRSNIISRSKYNPTKLNIQTNYNSSNDAHSTLFLKTNANKNIFGRRKYNQNKHNIQITIVKMMHTLLYL